MRRMIATTLTVLFLALAVCTLSHRGVLRVVQHARHLRTEAIEAMDEGDVQRAEERMVELAGYMERSGKWLEFLCEHNDLHEMKSNIIDAQASIEFGIEDDFYQAIYRFGEGLDHIAETERISIGNLY